MVEDTWIPSTWEAEAEELPQTWGQLGYKDPRPDGSMLKSNLGQSSAHISQPPVSLIPESPMPSSSLPGSSPTCAHKGTDTFT